MDWIGPTRAEFGLNWPGSGQIWSKSGPMSSNPTSGAQKSLQECLQEHLFEHVFPVSPRAPSGGEQLGKHLFSRRPPRVTAAFAQHLLSMSQRVEIEAGWWESRRHKPSATLRPPWPWSAARQGTSVGTHRGRGNTETRRARDPPCTSCEVLLMFRGHRKLLGRAWLSNVPPLGRLGAQREYSNQAPSVGGNGTDVSEPQGPLRLAR